MNAVAYARFSSDNQREESIDAQLRAIRDYANKNGIVLLREYVDEARSATTDKRPAFQQMFSDLRDVDAVIVHKLDRFSRDRYDSAFYKRELRKHGVKLISVLEPLDDSPESVILESVLEGMAEYYSKNLARETMKGLRETAYQCRHTGGMPPLGYDVVDGKYVINPVEADTVRIIFDMYANGKKYAEILTVLDGKVTKWGMPFTNTSLNSILRNEKYIGVYTFGRQSRKFHNSHRESDDVIRIPNGVPKIVNDDVWALCQERLKAKKRNPANTAKRVYVLSGKLVCDCGTTMQGASSVNQKGAYRYYRCRNCGQTVSADLVEKDIVKRITKHLRFTRSDAEKICRKLERERKKIMNDPDKINELKSVQRRIQNLLDAIQAGLYHPQMKTDLDDLMSLEKKLQDEIALPDLPSVDQIEAFLASVSELSKQPPEVQKQIIGKVCEKIKKDGTQFEVEFRLSMVAGDRNRPRTKYTILI